MTTVKCMRLKLSPDGMNCNAGRPCDRNAKHLRSDGKAFCSRCAKTERNGLFTDRFTWSVMPVGNNLNGGN